MDVYHPKALPPGETKSPLIFHVHGGGWSVGDKSVSGLSFRYFLDRGYTVVSPQYSFVCYG
jgi:acetyl esterase/lipase